MLEHQLSLSFNATSFIKKLEQRLKSYAGIEIERTYKRCDTNYMTISAKNKTKLKTVKTLLNNLFKGECVLIGEMECADLSKVPPPFQRVAS